MSDTKTQLVRCPSCGKETEYSRNNPFRPFCSERCQTIDLGAWADERYRVPVDESETATVNEKSREEQGFETSTPPKHRLN